MIQMQTRLDVADNTGAKEVMCIKVLGGSKRRTAGLGDIIVCSVKSVIAGSEVKKKARGQGRDRPLPPADAPHRRQLCPLRQQRGGVDRQRKESPRHAHLRRRRPRTARPEFHENRQPRQRGGLMHIRLDDMVEVIAGDDRGHAGQGAARAARRRTRSSSRESHRVYKHMRRSQQNPQGGRLSKEMPICDFERACWSVRPAASRPAPASGAHDDGSKDRYLQAKRAARRSGRLSPRRKKKASRPQAALADIVKSAKPVSNEHRQSRINAVDPNERIVMAKKTSKKAEASRAAPAGKPPVPRLLEKYRKGIAAGAGRRSSAAPTAIALPRLEEDRGQHGRGRARSPRRSIWKTPSPP